MGPGAQPRIDAANDLVGGPFTTLQTGAQTDDFHD